jgi:hypothetical protein
MALLATMAVGFASSPNVPAFAHISTGNPFFIEGVPAFAHISTGNPFFIEGVPHFTPMPQDLLSKLRMAGCSYAWQRQRHVASPKDATCSALVRPFLISTPGALLGFCASVLFSQPSFHPDTLRHPTMTSLLTEGADGMLTANLSSVGWTRDAPRILSPDSFSEVHPTPSFVHAAGAWSLELAGGGPLRSDEANQRAFEHCVALWLYLGHYAKQSEGLDGSKFGVWRNLLTRGSRVQLLHAVHGTMSAYLQTQMKRMHSRPTVALWDEVCCYARTPAARCGRCRAANAINAVSSSLQVDRVCSSAKSLDFALYVSCAHALGHALTLYVSSRRASVSEAVAICAHRAPDGRLALGCADGFYSEMAVSCLPRSTHDRPSVRFTADEGHIRSARDDAARTPLHRPSAAAALPTVG